MSKRESRPWEHEDIGQMAMNLDASSAAAAPDAATVPFLLVDGVPYLSDRFYLNRGVGDPPVGGGGVPSTNHECTCGARAPPPLLDRARLVASLNVKAAIVASYTLSPSHMIRTYPSLFGPSSTVPTLVLHGHKGFSDRLHKQQSKRTRSTTFSQQSDGHSSGGEHENDEWSASRFQQDAKRARIISKSDEDSANGVVCLDQSSDDENDESLSQDRIKSEYDEEEEEVTVKEEEPPEDAWLRKNGARIDPSNEVSFGKRVHLTEVLTTWLPDEAKDTIESLRKEQQAAKDDEEDDVIVLDCDDETTPVDVRFGVESFVAKRRQRKQGVHHPKFMILFETSGSVVVMVTTANLTPQHAVDATWVQRFDPLSTPSSDCDVTDATRCDGSDFGFVLANYLECQSLAARIGEMMPEVFLRRYLNYETLDDFHRRYRWNSQVHLVATIPGEYRGPKTATHLGMRGTKRTFLYGSQRVNDILTRLSESRPAKTRVPRTKPWLPQEFLSNDDRLIMQPTSFGGHWKEASFDELVRLYFDYEHSTDVSLPGHVHHMLETADIVWPTREYMATVSGRGKMSSTRVPSPDSVSSINPEPSGPPVSSDASSSFLFLSSISFNTIDFACISRMCMFEPSYPSQTPSNRSPHIKSFARVFEGDEYKLRKRFGIEKAEDYLPWLMLTSACLSRGAQGEVAPRRALDSDAMAYSNFELGVLFVSRLQGDDTDYDRLYCSRPSRCHCGEAHRSPEKSSVELIHLPLPYRLRPRRYHADEEDTDMCATPYFHEVLPGTGFVGQMRLTPLGAQLAASQL